MAAWQRSSQSIPPQEQASTHLCIIEPGTTTLRVLAAELSGQQATVWGWGEGPGWDHSRRDTWRLADVCEEGLRAAQNMAGSHAGRSLSLEHLLVGLPAHQLRGWAWTLTQRRTKPDRPVEERELYSLLGRALRLTVNRLTSPEDEDWILLDTAPAALTVDGHGVTDPVGFRAEEIGATVFAALADGATIERWRVLAERLGFSQLTLTASPLALAAVLSEPEGLLIDVGGATTDLTWWRIGRPVALASVPLGGAALTDSLRKKWSLSLEKAELLKLAYVAGELEDSAGAQVLEAMTPTLVSWFMQIEAELQRMTAVSGRALPQCVYLSGSGSGQREVFEAAKSLAYSERLEFDRHPQVEKLPPTAVPGVADRTGLGDGAGDIPALALAAWAAAQSQGRDRPAQLLADLAGSRGFG
jgi:hypothetical protein